MLLKRISNFIDNCSALGFNNALSLLYNFTLLKSQYSTIRLPSCQKPFYIRAVTSDLTLIKQFLPLFQDWRPEREDISVIIDAGANIGIFSVMMARLYPNARIIAIEPDPENFSILQQNCASYNNIELSPVALWFRKERLVISNPNSPHWERQVVGVGNVDKVDKNVIDAMTVSDVINEFKLDKIDIFKIDIEGAEEYIFKYGDLGWINNTKELLIELHESPEINIKETFFNALKNYSYHQEDLGEYSWLIFK